MMSRLVCCCLLAMMGTVPLQGEEISRAQRDLFEIHVRPLLMTHCMGCHGETKQEGGLQLTSLEGLLTGGDSGPAIVPGKPTESLIIEALRYESFEMPPEEQLEDKLVAGLSKWIEAGAPWPAEVTLQPPPKISDEDRDWWSFQPITPGEVPPVENDQWCRGEIDYFVLNRLAERDLQPAGEADRLVLARRVHFAITGLPPDEETISAALSDSFDYEALVDRLLESQAYGENQARFWLDLVRYAETDGYRADFDRPEAYRYRDYVIRSFNQDKPYDRFIKEQLAGDEIDPGNRDAIIATMYLRHWIYEHNQRDVETQWHEILSDITETTTDVFLAQGFKCARCHDHKFDPILQKDYYRMKAFFAAFQPSESHPIADAPARQSYQEKLRGWEQATAEIRARLREIEYPVVLKHATREGFDKFIPKIKTMILKPAKQRQPYEHQIASLAERQFDLPYDKLPEWLDEETQAERKRLQQQLAEFDELKPEPLETMEFVGSDVGPVAPVTYILDDESQTPIAPGFPTLFDPEDAQITSPPPALRSTGRRTALANWIADPENPFTARVIVNRIWQQHFGTGLVETSSDFGHLGKPPSHPALLDWLAGRFIEDGWSLKKLHRLILTSATYRQSSLRPIDDSVRRLDPANRLLWRMNPRRLSGEEVTDVVLSASGELASQKRAIYKPVKRNTPDPLLAVFDGPDRIRSNGKRHRTTTATQALLLANGPWLQERSEKIANRFARGDTVDDQVFAERVYRSLFGRVPSTVELDLAVQFIEQYASRTPVQPEPEVELIVAMPGDRSNAIDIKPEGNDTVRLEKIDSLPNGDFTVEAEILLRSLYKDAKVRTIVGHWSGNQKHSGWSLGVTSTKSGYQPRNLILQLVGNVDGQAGIHYEVVASGLRPELNKPYYVAARVDLSDPSEQGITFYLKDLSQPGAELQTARASHKVTKGIRPKHELTVGSRLGTHRWDGLIDSLRLENVSRDLAEPALADSAAGLPQYTVDLQFEDPTQPGFDSSGHGRHLDCQPTQPESTTPRESARIALVHALLNSNELIYVD